MKIEILRGMDFSGRVETFDINKMVIQNCNVVIEKGDCETPETRFDGCIVYVVSDVGEIKLVGNAINVRHINAENNLLREEVDALRRKLSICNTSFKSVSEERNIYKKAVEAMKEAFDELEGE